MLALILQFIEKSFGPHLAFAAAISFWLGAAMAAYVAIAPLLRVVTELKAARAGMEHGWMMQCQTCKRTDIVSGGKCGHCGTSLGIPLMVRIRNFFGSETESRWLRMTRWVLTVLGVGLFSLLTAIALIKSGAWHPQTSVERLFTGIALIAWAGVGWLAGRVFGIGTGGPISRLRDAILALAGFAVLSAAVTLAGAARPVSEDVLVRVTVQGEQAVVGGRAVGLANLQFGFEYLQVQHEILGFQHVVPLAVVGGQRIDLVAGEFERWLADHLWTHGQRYTARGLAVRKRTESVQASEPGTYEIVLREREVIARREGEIRAPPPAAN